MEQDKTIFCTYFDKGFLLKGLALHSSLIKHNPNAKLWILAFDKYTEKILKRLKLSGVTVIALRDFEDKELLSVKPSRHPVEYYWTCTPSWITYIMKKNPSVKYVTYLDGDLYFYSDPQMGVGNIGKKSLLAVEHRFPKGKENLAIGSGRFNVAFNVFKNDKIGVSCLKRWKNQCLEWCYWKHENGKLGDQMYLDEWPKLYGNNLAISKNVGLNAAPWNISQYKVTNKKSWTYINNDKLICYHFHQFQILGPNHFSRVLGYTLSKNVIKYIYEPYEEELKRQYLIVKKLDKNFEINIAERDKGVFLRQKLTRYFGPFYWKLKNIFK